MRIVLASAFVLLLAACGGGSGNEAAGKRSVVAAFYPLAWAAQQVGGSTVDVQNLTPPGAEPHDVELTPRDVERIQKADVVLYLSHGFQPAVEHAVDGARGEVVDVLAGERLRTGVGDEGGETDPHVWLDPVRFASVVRLVGEALDRPQRAARVAARVRALDRRYHDGLAHCARRDLVTTHAAFGYLAARYGLRQVPITGVDPESEPSARALARLVDTVRRDRVRTVFFEKLVSPRLAQTVAREAGVRTAELDPLEGLTRDDLDRGEDYVSVMTRNLRVLRQALGCR
jgi:zinc transport system substrate-binding protein